MNNENGEVQPKLEDKNPRIGGFLYFIGVELVLSAVILTYTMIYWNIFAPYFGVALPATPATEILGLRCFFTVTNLISTVVTITLVVLFLQKKFLFKRSYMYWCIYSIFIGLLSIGTDLYLTSAHSIEFYMKLGLNAVAIFSWNGFMIYYLKVSERVKRTFVR